MTPTIEQLEIISAVKNSSENILINALAGAAKTTTLELICKALPVQPILSLAFNKRIADEMSIRLPGHVQCRTLNSIGHRVWGQACSTRLVLNSKKSYEILSQICSGLKGAAKNEAYATFSDTLKIISHAKLSGYVPDGCYPHAKRLIEAAEFWAEYWEKWDHDEINPFLVDEVLKESIKRAYAGEIDFDDQIYMPTLFGGTFPSFPLVLVDEAQDLSPLNHAMLKKLVVKRLIAVGDPFQSIYGFRGAMQGGMNSLVRTFSMKEMQLSISFRCPRSIIKRARFRAPHMQWPEWATEGTVNELSGLQIQWSANLIPDGAAVICRNNAPLFSLAFKLLKSGRGVTIVGSDIGPSLIKTLKKLGPEDMNFEQTKSAIKEWERERLRKKKSEGPVRDKAECLRVFADVGGSLAGAIAYAESIFKHTGPIQLLSGHKSKGLEWKNVFHLDPWLIPSQYALTPEEIDQEQNIRYVIETRAKETLTLFNMEDFCA